MGFVFYYEEKRKLFSKTLIFFVMALFFMFLLTFFMGMNLWAKFPDKKPVLMIFGFCGIVGLFFLYLAYYVFKFRKKNRK
jgi:hypothetical protein